MSDKVRSAIRKHAKSKTAPQIRAKEEDDIVWKWQRLEKGWSHLREADDHLVELKRLYMMKANGKPVVISETADKKMVIQHSVADKFTLSEYLKQPSLFKDDNFHLCSVAIVQPYV